VLELIRRASPADAVALRHLTCRGKGNWTRDAQVLVRADVAEAVATGESAVQVLVALIGAEVVGVVAWSDDDIATTIHVLAVEVAWQRKGIGSRLKRRVMAESPTGFVQSSVHRRNDAMNALNETLNVEKAPDPEDGEYHICVVQRP
jgi:ribosomal protein S18 acetylase RimI-like enzyme